MFDRGASGQGVIPAAGCGVGSAQFRSRLLEGGGQGGVFDLKRGACFTQIVDSGKEPYEESGVCVGPFGHTADDMFDRFGEMAIPQNARHFCGVQHVA